MAYSDKVIDHYEQPRNVGSLDKNDDTVGTGIVGKKAAQQTDRARHAGRKQSGFQHLLVAVRCARFLHR